MKWLSKKEHERGVPRGDLGVFFGAPPKMAVFLLVSAQNNHPKKMFQLRKKDETRFGKKIARLDHRGGGEDLVSNP